MTQETLTLKRAKKLAHDHFKALKSNLEGILECPPNHILTLDGFKKYVSENDMFIHSWKCSDRTTRVEAFAKDGTVEYRLYFSYGTLNGGSVYRYNQKTGLRIESREFHLKFGPKTMGLSRMIYDKNGGMLAETHQERTLDKPGDGMDYIDVYSPQDNKLVASVIVDFRNGVPKKSMPHITENREGKILWTPKGHSTPTTYYHGDELVICAGMTNKALHQRLTSDHKLDSFKHYNSSYREVSLR